MGGSEFDKIMIGSEIMLDSESTVFCPFSMKIWIKIEKCKKKQTFSKLAL